MKKTIALLTALLLVVGTSAALMLSSQAEEARPLAQSVTWVYPSESGSGNTTVTLDANNASANDGKVTFQNGVLTIDSFSGRSVEWTEGDLTIVVKGEVTLNKPKNPTNIEMGNGCRLTVQMEEGSTLSLGNTSQDKAMILRGDVTFQGSGTVNIQAKQMAIQTAVDAVEVNFTVKDSVTLNVSGTANVIGDTSARHDSTRLNFLVKDKAAVSVTASDQFPFRFLSSKKDVALAVTVEDRGTLTIENPKGWLFQGDTPTTFANGNGTGLIVKGGAAEEDAKVVEDFKYNVTTYHYVNFAVALDEFTVKLPTVTGAKVEPAEGYKTTVTQTDDFKFTVTLEDNYSDSKITVKANGEVVEPDENGVYTLTWVSEDVTITVEGVTENKVSDTTDTSGTDTATDTSTQTNTGTDNKNPSTSASSVWMAGAAAVLAVVVVAGAVALTLRKKEN